MNAVSKLQTGQASFTELFTPKLVTVIREGYGASELRADAVAGLTVAIVALPLSMAIAIASGASPAQGLYRAIIGGFLVSLLGGFSFPNWRPRWSLYCAGGHHSCPARNGWSDSGYLLVRAVADG